MNNHYHDSDAESRHSGTDLSQNLSGYTGGSNSHGTSQRTGEYSTLSTVSIRLAKFKEFYENANTDADGDNSIIILTHDDTDNSDEYGRVGGLQWTGDADNEYIFGTAWLDKLYGGDGNDVIYGFENDDIILGQGGVDRLFGDGGDDYIKTGENQAAGTGNGDFASGGSGNDLIEGDDMMAQNEIMFGGPGHDRLFGFEGDD